MLTHLLNMEDFIKLVGLAVTFFALMVLIAVVAGIPLMLLWNWLMPIIFGLPSIDLGQAIGLSVLCQILFKNYSPSSSKSKK